VASRRNAVSRVAKWVKRRNPVVMDVGCNSGYLLRDLKQAFPESCLVGADYVADPLRKLARRLPDVPLLQFDLTTCPLPDECVDAAVLLNVLEHIEDHEAAARQLHRILRKGGVAIIEVPAGPDLYDIYDRQLMHFRRYSSNGLGNLLEKAGFEVRDRSHLGFFLYPPFALVKLRNKRHLSLPDREQMKIAAQHMTMARQNPLLNWVMSAEERIRYRIPLPFGIRCVAVGVKV
jgi:SAM-dependent methyltransferase